MTTSPASKRVKTSPPLIGTHNGHFHADEALAVYMLRLLPAYTPSTLLRTRDPTLLSSCHTVVDVGGEYDPVQNRYDHHQRTFDTTFPQKQTKLSSAGLVYLHFGKAIIAQRTGLDPESESIDILWRKLYNEFIEAIDANDNGISVYPSSETAKLEKRFNDGGITLSSLVSDLNHDFSIAVPPADDSATTATNNHDPLNPPPPSSQPSAAATDAQAAEDTRFLSASTLMGTTFLRKLHGYHTSWLPARAVVLQAYESRFQNDPQGRILVFREPTPWKDHLYTFESSSPSSSPPPNNNDNNANGEDSQLHKVLYVLYPESADLGAKWRIQAVPVSKDSFESRKPLPEAWRGVRDEELCAKSGVEGCVFVHASGFIGGNVSEKGVREMAGRAVEM
ncbi:MAG: hypothetical protein L6R37_004397 [Teloschistes peruensis]|nr:MAG: hypothetical protein L6R37_004397 [Teloschistes peruensis]